MKIKFKNWVAYIEDFYAPDATDAEIQILGNLIADFTVIVIPDQNITEEEDHIFSGRFGRHDLHLEVKEHYPDFFNSMQTFPTAPSITRVTGELNADGHPGLHGHDGDLDWHCGKTHNPGRVSLAYLRAVHGVEGSRTSWINGVHAYNDLSEEWKDRIKDVKINPSSSYGKYSTVNADFNVREHKGSEFGYMPNIVQTNAKGNKCLYFPFLQMAGLVDLPEKEEEEIITHLCNHYIQEKYMFHLDWKVNDLCISDQWSGLHKRWAFDGMKDRMVYRIGHDYDNINFCSDYLSGIEVIHES